MVVAGLVLSGLGARGAIVVQGVANQTVYTDSASFLVEEEAGHELVATLNGESVAVGTSVTLTEPRFYELSVTKTEIATSIPETLVVLFIVRSSARGSSENGIGLWVPRPTMPSAPGALQGGSPDLVTPPRFPVGRALPVVGWVMDGMGKPMRLNGIMTGDGLPGGGFWLHRGAGAVLAPAASASGSVNVTATFGAGQAVRAVEWIAEPVWTEVSGTITGMVDWGADARVRITADLTIDAGAALTIGAGSLVVLDAGVDILVNGELHVDGTLASPCAVFPAVAGQPWGGIQALQSGARVEATGTFFTGSGADPDWFPNHSGYSSHRDEEALLLLDEDSVAVLTDCWMFDLAGQVGNGSSGASLTMERCVVERAMTVGQFNNATVTITDCHLTQFPADDAEFIDNDNDALYLSGGTSVLSGTVLGWTKDDGIDAGGGGSGNVTVQNCWIESCFHEGMALSGTGKQINVLASVITNCGQAVECGYSGPSVTVRDSLLTANWTGARYGDNYDWGYGGLLDVQDSVVIWNELDVFDYEWETWTPHATSTPEVEVVNNLLTGVFPRHPANSLWDPASDGSAIAGLVPDAAIAVGVAVEGPGQYDVDEWGQGLALRFSEPRPQNIDLSWEVFAMADGGNAEMLSSGMLTVPAGQTVELWPVPAVDVSGYELVWVNFANSALAEFSGRRTVYFVPGLSPSPPEVLVAEQSSWSYHDGAVDLGTAWKEPGYDASAWATGVAELGFGDGDEETTIDGGPSGTRTPTVYFRHEFEVADATPFTSLHLRLRRDDGAVVWLNGAELRRDLLPDTGVGYGTYVGSATTNENSWWDSLEPATDLVTGTNVLAVEVHQADADSSDMSFDLELGGLGAGLEGFLLSPLGPGKMVIIWNGTSNALESSIDLLGWVADGWESPAEFSTDEDRRFFRLRMPAP